MQLQTTSPESKFPNEYIGVIFIQIDQHLKKLFKKYKGFPIFWNTVYAVHNIQYRVFITVLSQVSGILAPFKHYCNITFHNNQL